MTRPHASAVREKTEVLYGVENAVRLFSRVVSGAITTIDICDDDIIPHTPTSHKVIEKTSTGNRSKVQIYYQN